MKARLVGAIFLALRSCRHVAFALRTGKIRRMNIKKYIGDILRFLPSPVSRVPSQVNEARKLKRVSGRLNQEGAEKIFCIGMSRTGSTSLSRALERIGYNTIHFNNGSKIIDWVDFFDADAFLDAPVSARFETLYYSFENCKFIYLEREIDEWVKSISNFYDTKCPKEIGKYEINSGWGYSEGWPENNVSLRMMHKNLYTRYESWREAYIAFDDRVVQFFEEKSNDKLLRLNVTGGEGWQKLCSFLDVPVPDGPFPHVNSGASSSPWGSRG